MTNKRSIVIAAAGVAVAAVLAFAVLAVGLGNGSIVKQEQKSKGNGMAEKLEFKNPVTFELIDKNGKVVSKTVAYNAITGDGKAAIYEALATGSVGELNMITFSAATALGLDTDNDMTPDDTGPTLDDADVTCTANNTTSEVTCEATFVFDADYTPSADGNLILNDTEEISVGYYDGNTFTPYFTIVEGDTNEPNIPVDDAATYASVKITWTITIP